MRPLPCDLARPGGSRTASWTDTAVTPMPNRVQNTHISCFFTDQRTLEDGTFGNSVNASASIENGRRPGLGTMAQIVKVRGGDVDREVMPRPSLHRDVTDGRSASRVDVESFKQVGLASNDTPITSEAPSPFYNHPNTSDATMSRPFTPLSARSLAGDSLLSSPRSRRDSFGSESDSQMLLGKERDAGDVQMMDSGSSPQLVMPSIKMPSRRPFTEEGRHMGRLKVLVAGGAGTGKTSLIKAIVQACEYIVHVDSFATPPPHIPLISRHTRREHRNSFAAATSGVQEIYASTRAYPKWWSEAEDSRTLRRRKSLGDSVLERNLCFVDTHGFLPHAMSSDYVEPVVDYLEAYLKRIMALEADDIHIRDMLCGNGGPQVDVVLYLIKDGITATDLEYMRRLASLTNIIPLLAHADTLTADEISISKTQILSELSRSQIPFFIFPSSADAGSSSSSSTKAPFAISTIQSKDTDNMDASVLMSPDYICPLSPSELPVLVKQMFEHDTVAWLRYSAAHKSLAWRDRGQEATMRAVKEQRQGRGPSDASCHDRVHDDEAEWRGTLLSRSPQEHAGFPPLPRTLPTRGHPSSLLPSHSHMTRPPSHHKTSPPPYPSPSDPLGVLAWNARLARKARLVMRVLTGVSLVGCLFFLIGDTQVGVELRRSVRGRWGC